MPFVLMSFPGLDDQQFSERTLKGFLLKNVEPNSKNPAVQELNHFLVQRVDEFWDNVIVPLREKNNFDGNKINWYFQIYKEGLDARKLGVNPFTYVNVTKEQIDELVQFYKDKTLREYLALGTSFLSDSYSLLSSWIRDQMVRIRLEHIYSSADPVNWILCAEAEEHGVMSQKPEDVDGMISVLNNIGLIVSRRV